MLTQAEALAIDRLPGNTPWESAIIKRWIGDEGHIYRGFDFNVRIGTALDPGPTVPDSIRRGSIANTSKRIDCLAFTDAGVYIVEAKIMLDIRAWGQFEGYRHIVERDYPGTSILGYIAVAYSSTPDTVPFLRLKGVSIFLYPDLKAPQVRRSPA